MKVNNFIDTTSDDYYINPYKYINISTHNNQNTDLLLPNIDSEKNLNLIIKTLTSIIMSNNELSNDNIKYSQYNDNTHSNSKSYQANKLEIFKFVANNSINELKLFLYKNKETINIQDADGDTALHIAIFLSNYEACYILIKYGAHIFIKDKWGQIPLHRICFTLKNKNTLKIINLMLKYQKKNNFKNNIFNYFDNYNNTPLHLVIKYILKNNVTIDKNILLVINKLIELTNINLINNDGLSIKDLINMLDLTK